MVNPGPMLRGCCTCSRSLGVKQKPLAYVSFTASHDLMRELISTQFSADSRCSARIHDEAPAH